MNDMFTLPKSRRKAIYAAVVSTIVTVSAPAIVAATGSANPCAARRVLVAASSCNPCNPCNPCAARKCNPCNPCATRKCNPCNPCAAKNPCNPCNPCAAKLAAGAFMRPAGTKLYSGNADALLAEGKRLWNDTSLSTNGISCETCHTGGVAFNQSFTKPYPHKVAMPSQQSGVGVIHADEMVQFCLRVPMQAKALPWESRELAALTAYTVELQKRFKYNPCAAKSPCNPCNPCATKKPCNPCNPCAVKKANPCKSSRVTLPGNAMAVKKNS